VGGGSAGIVTARYLKAYGFEAITSLELPPEQQAQLETLRHAQHAWAISAGACPAD
jgi:hypothetical protein